MMHRFLLDWPRLKLNTVRSKLPESFQFLNQHAGSLFASGMELTPATF